LVESYHLEKVKKKIKVSTLENLDKGVRKHANLVAPLYIGYMMEKSSSYSIDLCNFFFGWMMKEI